VQQTQPAAPRAQTQKSYYDAPQAHSQTTYSQQTARPRQSLNGPLAPSLPRLKNTPGSNNNYAAFASNNFGTLSNNDYAAFLASNNIDAAPKAAPSGDNSAAPVNGSAPHRIEHRHKKNVANFHVVDLPSSAPVVPESRSTEQSVSSGNNTNGSPHSPATRNPTLPSKKTDSGWDSSLFLFFCCPSLPLN